METYSPEMKKLLEERIKQRTAQGQDSRMPV